MSVSKNKVGLNKLWQKYLMQISQNVNVEQAKVISNESEFSSLNRAVTSYSNCLNDEKQAVELLSKKALRPNGATKDSLTLGNKRPSVGVETSRKVFKVLEDHKITVDAVNTTEASVTIALTNSLDLDEFTKAFIEVGQVSVQNSKGLISIIGCNLSQSTDLTNSIFKPLKALPLDMISFSKEKRIINMVVNEDEMITTAQAIHDTLFG